MEKPIVTTRGKYSSLLWLFVLGSLWGSSFLFIKVTVAYVPPLTLVAGRLFAGAVIIGVMLWATGQKLPKDRGLWAIYALMGLLNGALPYSLITWGEQHISSGLAALLQATMPIFTVLLAHFFAEDERMTWLKIGGVVLGFVGVGILIVPGVRQGLRENVMGQLAVVMSSLSYAAATVFARQRLRGRPPLTSTFGQFSMGALFMVPLSLMIERPFDLALPLQAAASWMGLVILGTVLAYMIYYRLLARTSATFVSMVTYIVPVNGLILGALVLSEPLSVTLGISLLLILLGVLLVRK